MTEAATHPQWKPGQRLVLWLSRHLAPMLLRGLGATLRFELPGGVPPAAASTPPEAAIYAFWHRCLVPMACFNRGRGFGILISQHFDGEWIAQAAERMGFRIFRGSSTRGGAAALAAMTLAVREGASVGFTVDGPRGPVFQAKPGPIYLARGTGRPVYAVHFAIERAWTLKSWDRFQIPKPGSRIRGLWAGPLQVPADASASQLEELRAQLETMLNRLRLDGEAGYTKGHSGTDAG